MPAAALLHPARLDRRKLMIWLAPLALVLVPLNFGLPLGRALEARALLWSLWFNARFYLRSPLVLDRVRLRLFVIIAALAFNVFALVRVLNAKSRPEHLGFLITTGLLLLTADFGANIWLADLPMIMAFIGVWYFWLIRQSNGQAFLVKPEQWEMFIGGAVTFQLTACNVVLRVDSGWRDSDNRRAPTGRRFAVSSFSRNLQHFLQLHEHGTWAAGIRAHQAPSE
jgi:hypothetical protein